MFNPTELLIDKFVEHLYQAYGHTYSNLEPSYIGPLTTCRTNGTPILRRTSLSTLKIFFCGRKMSILRHPPLHRIETIFRLCQSETSKCCDPFTSASSLLATPWPR